MLILVGYGLRINPLSPYMIIYLKLLISMFSLLFILLFLLSDTTTSQDGNQRRKMRLEIFFLAENINIRKVARIHIHSLTSSENPIDITSIRGIKQHRLYILCENKIRQNLQISLSLCFLNKRGIENMNLKYPTDSSGKISVCNAEKSYSFSVILLRFAECITVQNFVQFITITGPIQSIKLVEK